MMPRLLSLLMTVGKECTDREGTLVWYLESYPGPCPGLGPGMCLGWAGSLGPVHYLPQFSILHGSLPPAGGSSSLAHRPCPRLPACPGSFSAPEPLLRPSRGLYCQAVSVHLASSSYSFQRSNSCHFLSGSLPWPSGQSWSSYPSLTHGADSGIAVHVLAGMSEGASSPSTASSVLVHVCRLCLAWGGTW